MAHDPSQQAAPKRDELARHVLAPIEPGMVVGLGTGRVCERLVKALAQRVLDERLDIACVCTSRLTERHALDLGLPVRSFDEVDHVDYLFDGASEADPSMRLLKGHSGAIARQRLVAKCAQRRVYVVSEERLSDRLGTHAPLSVTILPFGVASIRASLRELGLSGVPRRTIEGEPFLSDDQGWILDLRMPQRDPNELALELDRMVGVIDHGLFLDEADEILVECPSGEVRHLTREG